MQPTPVLSLRSDLRSPSLSSQAPPAPAGEQTSLSGWWVLVGTDPLCGNLSTLPSAPCAALSSVAPKLPPSATHSLRQWRGFLVCGNLSSFTAPSLWCRSHPYSFVCVFSFFFHPTQVRGEFLAFWEVWGLPAFSRCFVGVVPHVDVFRMYLWGGRWSPRLTPLPSWRSPFICFSSYLYIPPRPWMNPNFKWLCVLLEKEWIKWHHWIHRYQQQMGLCSVPSNPNKSVHLSIFFLNDYCKPPLSSYFWQPFTCPFLPLCSTNDIRIYLIVKVEAMPKESPLLPSDFFLLL